MEIYTKLIQFHNGKINEVVTENEDGSYTIFIEESLCKEERLKAYRHALLHINQNHFGIEYTADLAEQIAHKGGNAS